LHHITDTLGRRARLTPQSTGKRVSPTERDLLWFSKLTEHGPLPSSFLHAYAGDTHRSEKRARERLTDLFNEDNTPDGGPYFTRPLQQFRTLDSRYNQLVYDLAPAGMRALKRLRPEVAASPAPSGPWLHRFMTSCITASIELATLKRGDLSYISQSEILCRAKAKLRYPVTFTDPLSQRTGQKDLIPDAVFGLRYHTDAGDRFRFFAVEADRATEPASSTNWNRKSFLRNLRQYEAYLGGKLYRAHLNLTAPLFVLTVSSDPRRTERMLDMMSRDCPAGAAFMLFQTWEDFGAVFRPPAPNHDLLTMPWLRAGYAPFSIHKP
jgi:Replication-relaxation